MARIGTFGAESGTTASILEDGSVGYSGSPELESTIVRSGKYSWKFVSNAAQASALDIGTATAEFYGRGYIYFESLPGSTVHIANTNGSTATNASYSLRLTSTGIISMWDDVAGTKIGSDYPTALIAGKWYRIEMYCKYVASSNNDLVEGRIDGDTIATTSTGTSAQTIGHFTIGWVSALSGSVVCYVDDVAVNDTTGGSQNSWCGEGKVVFLYPVSDNARATLWTGGLGTAPSPISIENNFNASVPGGSNFKVISVDVSSDTLDNKLVLVFIENDGDGSGIPEIPVISGLGATWTQVATVTYNNIATPFARLTLFAAVTDSMRGYNDKTILLKTSTDQTSGFYTYITTVRFVDVSSVANAIPHSATNRADSAASLTVTLPAFNSASNGTMGFFVGKGTINGLAVGSGFTKATGFSADLVEYKTTNDTTVDCTATSGTGNMAGIAIEIKAAAQLYRAVSNIPPQGTASENDFTQIEHAGGAAGTTDAYDVNMGAYADPIAVGGGGMFPNDTVSLVQYLISTGEDVATGTKLLAIAGVSNPTVAQGSSFDVFASGALGTFPTNWTRKTNGLAIQYNPSVTLATKPVMRVVRPETASRVASVCSMIMLVEYVQAPRQQTTHKNQSINRSTIW